MSEFSSKCVSFRNSIKKMNDAGMLKNLNCCQIAIESFTNMLDCDVGNYSDDEYVEFYESARGISNMLDLAIENAISEFRDFA